MPSHPAHKAKLKPKKMPTKKKPQGAKKKQKK